MISTLAFILLMLSLVIQIIFLLRKSTEGISHWILLLSSILLFATTLHRSIQINFIAITNTFESLIFFSGAILLTLFLYRLKWKEHAFPFIIFGGSVIAAALLAISSSPIAPQDIVPPIPALQSNWLTLHVSFAFIGEAFFVISFVSAISYLVTKDQVKKKKLDKLTYTAIAIGYPIYTAGALIFGAIWASYAWGSFWSWDPKETWALITWIVYTAYLHSRFVKSLRGNVSAWLSILGFLFTLFTFFGVNFLLSGLHSYG